MQYHISCSVFFKIFTAIHLLFFISTPTRARIFVSLVYRSMLPHLNSHYILVGLVNVETVFQIHMLLYHFKRVVLLFLSSEIAVYHFYNLNIRQILLIIKLKFSANFITDDILTITNITFLLKYKHNLHLFNKYIMQRSRWWSRGLMGGYNIIKHITYH